MIIETTMQYVSLLAQFSILQSYIDFRQYNSLI